MSSGNNRVSFKKRTLKTNSKIIYGIIRNGNLFLKKGGKMLTTGIWKIEKRLDNVLNYTTNAEKIMVLEYFLGHEILNKKK